MIDDTALISHLAQSLLSLEDAINGAEIALANCDRLTPSFQTRIDSYRSILASQKTLTAELQELVADGEACEITRKITIINGLSEMIMEDASDVFRSLGNGSIEIEQPAVWC